MKKPMVIIGMFTLLLALFGACGLLEDRKQIADSFEAFIEDMVEMEAYQFRGNVFVHLPEMEATHITISGSVSHNNREMAIELSYQDASRAEKADLQLLLFDQTLYTYSASMLESRFQLALESAGVDPSRISLGDVLAVGWVEKEVLENVEVLYFSPLTMGVDPYFIRLPTRDGQRYTIQLYEQDVSIVLDDILALIQQLFIADAGFHREEMLEAAIASFTNASLAYAQFSLTSSYEEGIFQQAVSLTIPHVMEIWGFFTFIPQTVFPLTPPGETISQETLDQFFQQLNPRNFLPGLESGDEVNIEIMYGLSHLNLANQDLTLSPYFIPRYFPDNYAAENTLLVPAGRWVQVGENEMRVDAVTMGLYYFFAREENAVEAIVNAVAVDRARYFLPDSTFVVTPLQTDTERNIGRMAILENTLSGMTRVYFYFAQVLEEGVTIRLGLTLYLHLFTDYDFALLDALGGEIAVDLGEMLWTLAGDSPALLAILTAETQEEES